MITEPTHRLYRVSRWLAVHLLAFALRHGLSDDEALTALRQAYRHRRDDAAWRLGILDDAHRRNVHKSRRKAGWA